MSISHIEHDIELWDVLDEYGNKTGKLVERGKPLKQNQYHLVVDAWIKNDNNQYLITKRTSNKTFPNMWETIGGSAITGDDSLVTALREVKEEIGIELSPQNGKCLFRIKRQLKNFPFSYFKDIWLFKENIDVSKLKFQQDEVCDAKWVRKDEVLKLIDENIFVNVYNYLEELFEE